ncbi:MAG TPA: hypothetical protein VHE35_25455 [Kofleriaceae bacterium]|nr:hypothetical protein [Kofleriaceae bacterium]
MARRGLAPAVRALALAGLVLGACGHGAHRHGPPARRAFYYWRTTFSLSEPERSALADTGATRLFVRLFDVDWDADTAGPETLGPITVPGGPPPPAPPGVELVPVVYLRNELFTRLPADRTADTAGWVWHAIDDRDAALGLTPHELQLDCDWTDSTRDRYFAFLDALGAIARPRGVALSATIRLHQIKYRERTGVPPVERGMLMFYNMGRFSADPDARAIFDPASARAYLGRISSYPLPLDVALPIWSWVVHLRDEQVVGLMQSTDPDELAGLDFLRPLPDGRWQVTRNAFLHGTLLRQDDLLKVEETGPDETLDAARMVWPHLAARGQPRTVALFDLSERNLRRHAVSDLDHVFRTVR